MIPKITRKASFLVALAAPYVIFSMCNESEIEKTQKRIEIFKNHFFVEEKTENNLLQIENSKYQQQMSALDLEKGFNELVNLWSKKNKIKEWHERKLNFYVDYLTLETVIAINQSCWDALYKKYAEIKGQNESDELMRKIALQVAVDKATPDDAKKVYAPIVEAVPLSKDNKKIVKNDKLEKLLNELAGCGFEDDGDYGDRNERHRDNVISSIIDGFDLTIIVANIDEKRFFDAVILWYLIPKLIRKSPHISLSSFLKFINEQTLTKMSGHLLLEMLNADTSLVLPVIIKHLNKDNFDKLYYYTTFTDRLLGLSPHIIAPLIIKHIIEKKPNDHEYKQLIHNFLRSYPKKSKYIYSAISEKNIAADYVKNHILPDVFEIDPKGLTTHILKLINATTIKNNFYTEYIIPKILMVDSGVAQEIVKSITKNNCAALSCKFYALLTQKGKDKVVMEALRINCGDIVASKTSARLKELFDLIKNIGLPVDVFDKFKELESQVYIAISNIYAIVDTQDILQLIDEESIRNYNVAYYVVTKLLEDDSKKVIPHLIKCITKDTVYNTNVIEYVIPKILRIDQNSGKKIAEQLNLFIVDENSKLDVYFFAPKKATEYFMLQDKLQLRENQKMIKNDKDTTPSYHRFEVNYPEVINIVNHRFDIKKVHGQFSAPLLQKYASLRSMYQYEKVIIKNGNYSIAHGRSAKLDRFVNDQSFLHLMDIFNLFFGNNKEIDKTCHYTQHYAFPREQWEEAFVSHGQTCDFRGLTINLPYNRVATLVKTGITSSKELSYERSTLQFGSNFLGTKWGSSALDYALANGNVDEKRGSVTIESLFKRLGKMVGKDLSKYYKKYEKAFALICKAGEKFEHGTLLLYEFTPKTLQEYVKVTHSSGGHIDNKDSGILIKGKRTTDPKKVLDTLINNPEDFDEPTHDYEFFWPLTDEVTANMHSDEVKTYAFHIGKHDELLAKNIKHWIAKVFEHIKCDMAQDGIIKYSPVQQSKL